MSKTAILSIRILSDSKAAKKDLDDTATSVQKFESGVGKMAPAAGIALGAVVLLGKGAITAAEGVAVADNRITAITNSMGLFGEQSADVSKQVIKDANDWGGKIGVDPQIIKQGQAALMTFAEVGKSAGDAGGMFDRATKASTDLAAGGFGSIESASVMLGKALNDPTVGMTALARVGVGFTEDQKNMITTLQASGDMLGAQNIVMANVERQVGGTALATATASGKMKVALDGITETIGAALLPAVDQASVVVIALSGFISEHSDVIVIAGGIIAGLAAGVLVINGAFKLWHATTAAFTTVQWLMNAALTANPIGLVVMAVVLLIATLVLAYQNVGWFRDGVDAMGRFVGDIFNWIGDRVSDAIGGLKDFLGWMGIINKAPSPQAPAAQDARAMQSFALAPDASPMMARSMAAPAAAFAAAPALTNTGGGGGTARQAPAPAPIIYNIDVQVEAAYDKSSVAREIKDMLDRYARSNGAPVSTGVGRL